MPPVSINMHALLSFSCRPQSGGLGPSPVRQEHLHCIPVTRRLLGLVQLVLLGVHCLWPLQCLMVYTAANIYYYFGRSGYLALLFSGWGLPAQGLTQLTVTCRRQSSCSERFWLSFGKRTIPARRLDQMATTHRCGCSPFTEMQDKLQVIKGRKTPMLVRLCTG